MARLSGGNLNNGANAGRFYANLNNALSNANWNYAARIYDMVFLQCVSPPLRRLDFRLGRNARNFLNQHQAPGKTGA